jgi:hypothetical protein
MSLKPIVKKKLYSTKINGFYEKFESQETRDFICSITYAARDRQLCKITYLNSGLNKIRIRIIAAYSFKDGYLYLASTHSGMTALRGYIANNIRSVQVLTKKFKPQWEITL